MQSRDKDEIVRKLRQIGALKTGDVMPEWLGNPRWGEGMSALCRDAADLIEELSSQSKEFEEGWRWDRGD